MLPLFELPAAIDVEQTAGRLEGKNEYLQMGKDDQNISRYCAERYTGSVEQESFGERGRRGKKYQL